MLTLNAFASWGAPMTYITIAVPDVSFSAALTERGGTRMSQHVHPGRSKPIRIPHGWLEPSTIGISWKLSDGAREAMKGGTGIFLIFFLAATAATGASCDSLSESAAFSSSSSRFRATSEEPELLGFACCLGSGAFLLDLWRSDKATRGERLPLGGVTSSSSSPASLTAQESWNPSRLRVAPELFSWGMRATAATVGKREPGFLSKITRSLHQ
mmetsp:Transcript_63643/g.113262  ORF Transcript_63643/g.113262 Transcript_63643/m.113262 type:complete len:213 (-) Transcript_63643:963-1601(-)